MAEKLEELDKQHARIKASIKGGKLRWEDKTKKQISEHISMMNQTRIKKMQENKKLLNKIKKN